MIHSSVALMRASVFLLLVASSVCTADDQSVLRAYPCGHGAARGGEVASSVRLAYAFSTPVEWRIRSRGVVRHTHVGTEATGPELPDGLMAMCLRLREVGSARSDGDWDVALSVVRFEDSLTSSTGDSFRTQWRGGQARKWVDGEPVGPGDGVWAELLEELRSRMLFGAPLHLTMRANGCVPGVRDLPPSTLNAIPGESIPVLLSCMHPTLPQRAVRVGTVWREMRPTGLDPGSDGGMLVVWRVEHIRDGLVTLTGRGRTGTGFSLTDALGGQAVASGRMSWEARVDFDTSVGRVRAAEYTTKYGFGVSTAAGLKTDFEGRVRVRSRAG